MDKKNLSQQLTERAAELATELAKIDSGERPLTKAAKAGVRSNVHWKRRTCLLLANLLEGKELQKSDEETIEHYAIVLERSTLMFEKGQTVITVMQNNPTYSYDRIVKAVEKKGHKIYLKVYSPTTFKDLNCSLDLLYFTVLDHVAFLLHSLYNSFIVVSRIGHHDFQNRLSDLELQR